MSPRKNPYARPDRFTRAAKDAGFPARSVFKLEEIDRRVRLLRSGMRVLDLGATPGSWSIYAAQRSNHERFPTPTAKISVLTERVPSGRISRSDS